MQTFSHKSTKSVSFTKGPGQPSTELIRKTHECTYLRIKVQKNIPGHLLLGDLGFIELKAPTPKLWNPPSRVSVCCEC